jgi:hypothetical protein
MTARAPRVATWLLLRFSSGPHGEAIAGDLMEQYAERQSRWWYWRQVLSAIRADIVNTVSGNKWRTAVAIAIGWVAYVAASFPVTSLIRASRPIVSRWSLGNGLPHEWLFWLQLVQRTVIVTIAFVAIGWLVSTVSRRSAPAAVCILAISVLIFEYGMIALLFSTRPSPSSISTAELLGPALFVLARPAGILAGGLLATRARTTVIVP